MNFFYLKNRIVSKLNSYLISNIRNGLPLKGLDSEKSLELLLENKKSLIRWGDGETVIVMGGNIPFQKYSNLLRRRLIEIMEESYADKFYFAIPWKNLIHPLSVIEKNIWLHTRYLAYRYLKSNTLCLDAHLFRNDRTKNHIRLPDEKVEKLWMRFERIIIVSGNEKYIEQFIQTYHNKDCVSVKVPDKNAFEKYNEIKEKICSLINEHENTCLLLSCGPCAKILAYDLCEIITCYDIGHYLSHRYSKRNS